jgi:hypothetical protein
LEALQNSVNQCLLRFSLLGDFPALQDSVFSEENVDVYLFFRESKSLQDFSYALLAQPVHSRR